MSLLRKYVSRGAVVLLFLVTVLVGTSGSSAQAATYCNMMLTTTFGIGNALPNRECLTYVSSRGYRGYVEFNPPQAYQLAGRFFVTLTRNSTQVAKSFEYVNPIVNPGTTWPTPYVQKGSGYYCTKVWFRRTSTINDLIRYTCRQLP
jgi:hypothetical protein